MIVDGMSKKSMLKAVALIKAGDVVAFPTETVYGLGADARNSKAVEKIFRVKQRPFADPLIVHVADEAGLEKVVVPFTGELRDMAETLTKRFWPGPLTIIFDKSKEISDLVTGGLPTVGVRMPDNLIARALIMNSETPIAAPSANRFQSISPTTAEAVKKELGGDVPLILDGGPCQVGVESTVLALKEGPMILRPGGVSQEELEYVLNTKVPFLKSGETHGPLPSPGILDFHYAPKKPLRLFSTAELEKYVVKKSNMKKVSESALLCFSKKDFKKFKDVGFFEVVFLSERGQLKEAARELYSKLRLLDSGRAKNIFTLKCPDEQLGVTLNDRLKRAVHENR